MTTLQTPLAQTAVLLDIDGVLAPIVDDPAAVAVSATTQDLLRSAVETCGAVGVVTGRSLHAARELVTIPGIWIAAAHGMHVAHPDGSEWIDPAASRAREQLDLTVTMAQTVGWRYEDKGHCVTLHFRHVARPEQTAAQMRAQIATVLNPTIVELHDARMALEVRPVGSATKGAAVQRILEESGLDSAIYVGDDRTDLDAFRQLEGRDALRVAVASDEAPSELLEEADLVLDDQAAVEHWLRQLLAAG
jgi:trehalose 6-phosphate phosphatase